jgi:ABC-type transport system involved in cytochrome bd biosynthesis fused ATPase/permease subunit
LFFRDTVRANILFGRETIDDAALRRAVECAGLGPVLAGLAGGLDAPMGDGGNLLSGGERQRVAIARALVHAPQLLILDEPSNHLDGDALALLIERLFIAPSRPTCLIATHDPRLLAIADAIYDLRGGLLVRRPRLRLATSP